MYYLGVRELVSPPGVVAPGLASFLVLVGLVGLVVGCQARPAAMPLRTGGGASEAAASAEAAASPKDCPSILSKDEAQLLPSSVLRWPSVTLRLPPGIEEVNLIGPPPATRLNPEHRVARTLRTRTFPSSCGLTIVSMTVGLTDDDQSVTMPEFVRDVLHERLDFEAGELEEVAVRGRNLNAVVRSADDGEDALWVSFQRPDGSCKSYFVVLAAGGEDFIGLLPTFKAVSRSMRVVGENWRCILTGGGGGYG